MAQLLWGNRREVDQVPSQMVKAFLQRQEGISQYQPKKKDLSQVKVVQIVASPTPDKGTHTSFVVQTKSGQLIWCAFR